MPDDALAPHVVIVTHGEPETGLWCPTCLLPSAVLWPLVLIGENGADDAGCVILCDGCDPA